MRADAYRFHMQVYRKVQKPRVLARLDVALLLPGLASNWTPQHMRYFPCGSSSQAFLHTLPAYHGGGAHTDVGADTAARGLLIRSLVRDTELR